MRRRGNVVSSFADPYLAEDQFPFRGSDARLVKIVAHGHNESCLGKFTGDSHLPRNLPLVWAPLAAPVANDRKSQSRLVISREIAGEYPSCEGRFGNSHFA